jgi:hypothetical protein
MTWDSPVAKASVWMEGDAAAEALSLCMRKAVFPFRLEMDSKSGCKADL